MPFDFCSFMRLSALPVFPFDSSRLNTNGIFSSDNFSVYPLIRCGGRIQKKSPWRRTLVQSYYHILWALSRARQWEFCLMVLQVQYRPSQDKNCAVRRTFAFKEHGHEGVAAMAAPCPCERRKDMTTTIHTIITVFLFWAAAEKSKQQP